MMIKKLSMIASGVLATTILYAAPAGRGEPSWLAFGDFRGHVEPCGCNPATDLGGIERLGGYVAQVKRLHPAAWRFDLGNNLGEADDPLQLKLWLETWRTIQPDAVLLNRREATQAASLKHSSGGKAGSRIPFVCGYPGQGREASTRGLCDDVLTIRGSGLVLGYVEGGAQKDLSSTTIDAWRTILRDKGRGRTKILLFAGGDRGLQQIQEARLFDQIISSNTTPGNDPTPIEKDEPGRLLRQGGVYMVPAFGQGVLLGGSLRQSVLDPLVSDRKDCVRGPGKLELGSIGSKSAKGACPPESGLMLSGGKVVTWLDRTQGTLDSGLQKPWSRYQQGIRAQYQQWVTRKKKENALSPFAGAQSCQSCHGAEYEAWAASRHAQALVTLQAKHKDQDKACVTCHVVGFDQAGGFIDAATTPLLAGVQCENCHGPRRQHTRDPHTFKGAAGEGQKVCASCHHVPHSAAFRFEDYWPKIKHGKGS